MSLADYYALNGANAIESACAGDDVVLSPSDPGEYKRLAREAQHLLLRDLKVSLSLLTHVTEWDDGGWRAAAIELLDRMQRQAGQPTRTEITEAPRRGPRPSHRSDWGGNPLKPRG